MEVREKMEEMQKVANELGMHEVSPEKLCSLIMELGDVSISSAALDGKHVVFLVRVKTEPVRFALLWEEYIFGRP